MDLIQTTYAFSDAWPYTVELQMASKDFQGVCLDDLMVLEQLFSLNVYVYDLQEM